MQNKCCKLIVAFLALTALFGASLFYRGRNITIVYAKPSASTPMNEEYTSTYVTTTSYDEYISMPQLEDNSYLTDEEMEGKKSIFFPEKLFGIFKDAFTKGAKSVIKWLSLAMSLLVVASLFKTTKSLSPSSALNSAYDYFSVLLVSATAYSITAQVFETSKKALDGLSIYFASLMPIMTTLQITGGNTAVAASSGSTLVLFMSTVEIISDKILLSLIGIAFALAIISALPSSVNLKSVSSLIKNTSSVILAFLFSMFGFVMIFQTAVAAAADNAAIRSLRFASGVFIPVIGNMVGENIKSLITAVGTVKASVGAIGVVTVFSIVLPPIIFTVMYKLSILLCAILARVLGLDKESDFLYEINSLFNVLVAIMCGVGMLFIISIAVFVKTQTNLA